MLEKDKKEIKDGFDKEKAFWNNMNDRLVTFAIYYRDGNGVLNSYRPDFSGCHAMLKAIDDGVRNNKKNMITILGYVPKKKDNKDYMNRLKTYINWFMYQYSDVLENESAEEILEYGLFVNPDNDRNYVCSTLFASRMFWEEMGVHGKVWTEFLKLGVHPSLSFLLSHLYMLDGSHFRKSFYTHSSIAYNEITPGYALNYINSIHSQNITYKKDPGYYNVTGVWYGGMGTRFDEKIHSLVQKLNVSTTSKDIFNKNKTTKILSKENLPEILSEVYDWMQGFQKPEHNKVTVDDLKNWTVEKTINLIGDDFLKGG